MCHDAVVIDEDTARRFAELDEYIERWLPAGPASPNGGGHRVSARSLISQSPFFGRHGVTPSVAFLMNGGGSGAPFSPLLACQVRVGGGPWQTVEDGRGKQRRIVLLPDAGDFAVRVIHRFHDNPAVRGRPPLLTIAYELPQRPIRADDALLIRCGYLGDSWKRGWKGTWLSGVIGAGPLRRRIAARGEPRTHPRYVDLRTGQE